MLWMRQQCKQVVVNHLTNRHSRRHWTDIWKCITLASAQDLTHYHYNIVGLIGKGQLEMLIVLLDGRQVDLVPFGLQTRLLDGRVPIQQLALLARSNLHWLSVHHLLVYYHVVELNGQLLCSIEADICCLAIDHTCNVIHYLLGHSSISSHCQLLIVGSLHRVSKRYLLGQHSIYSCIVGDYELSLHTTWSAEGSHWHLKDMLARESICLTFCQHISHYPCLILWSRSRYFLNAQVERLVGIQFEIYIILFELIDEYAAKLLGHLATSRDSPIITEHYAGRTVETKVECHGCILASLVSNYEVEFLVLCFHCSQVQAIPFLTSLNLHATPIEVNCIFAGQVHDFACLILLRGKFDFFLSSKLQFNVRHIQLQELLHILAPKLIVIRCNGVFSTHCSVLTDANSKEGLSHSSLTIHCHLDRLVCKVCQVKSQSRIYHTIDLSKIHAIPFGTYMLMPIFPVKVDCFTLT